MNALATTYAKRTFLPYFIEEMGMAGQVILSLFVTALVFAWLIHCRGWGLRHRLSFFLLSLFPLLISVYYACHAVVTGARRMRIEDPSRGLSSYSWEPREILSVVTLGSSLTALLLIVSSVLFLSKNATPSRTAPHAGVE